MHELQALTFHLLNDDAQYALLPFRVFWQEHQSCAVVPLFRNRNALQQDEFMWYLHHHTCAVAVLSNFRTTVSHVLEYLQGIIHQLVTLSTM